MQVTRYKLQGGDLAFETPDGHWDRHVSAELFVALLRALSPGGEPLDAALAARVEAHLAAQQEAALAMQHCSRAWMERAAAERAAATRASAEGDPSSRWSPVRLGLAEVERQSSLGRLLCVMLNCCSALHIGRDIVRALPGVAVVCWATPTEDAAARAFVVGFCGRLAQTNLRPSGSRNLVGAGPEA